MRTPRQFLLLSIALFAALLLSGGSLRASAQAHSAPLELLRSGHLAVQVRVNGQGPFRLILDTGSPLTFISTHTARQLGLLPPQPNKPARPGGLFMGGQVTLKSIAVGDTQVKNLSALILDHPIVEALGGFVGRLDGIVGFSFFARFHTTIDYGNARVTFSPVDYVPQDIMTGMMSRLMGGSQKARVIAPRTLWGLTVAPSPQNDGALVTQVYPDSAALAAGFQPGDRITILDDRWTDTVNDLYEAAALIVPTQPVIVKVMRGEKEILLTIHPRLGF
jgi:membrane-associated protease RseP (regulator of RpoE activity)